MIHVSLIVSKQRISIKVAWMSMQNKYASRYKLLCVEHFHNDVITKKKLSE